MHLGVLTSGGDAPGMNAAIRAVVRAGIFNSCRVTGIRRGLLGLMAGEAQPMDLGSVADIIYRGGTILHTGRSPDFQNGQGLPSALEAVRALGLDGLVVIGGDGSARAALKLAQAGVRVVAIPATIDNDVPGSDDSIGFDTAVNTIAGSVDRVRDTATALERGFVIEVMGRDSGHLALAAGVATGAESILIPEFPTSMDLVCQRLKRGLERNKLHSIIIVAEGVAPAQVVADQVKEKSGMELRVTVLGYVQRGGSPTAADRILASRLGEHAVEVLLAARHGIFIGTRGNQTVECDLEQVARARKEIDQAMFRLAHVLSI
ncbi:MAG: ATP-dependent 6-phosphofructokinase [Bacillota bacterium]